jgi:hypothetical protein
MNVPEEKQPVDLVQLPAVIPDPDAADQGGQICGLARAEAPHE